MDLTSGRFVALMAVLAVIAVGAVPWTWDTWGPRSRRVGRSALTIVATGSVLLAGFAFVNAKAGFFPTLTSLTTWQGAQLRLGHDGVVQQLSLESAGLDLRPADAARQAGQGAVVAVELPGTRSGIRRRAAVYLPDAYFDPTQTAVRFPVLEVLSGSPGSPAQTLKMLGLAHQLDTAIDQHRMAPTIVVVPDTNGSPVRDRECVDAVHGAQDDTYLTADVQSWVGARLRALPPGPGWALLGTSTGGYCAVNLVLRHPDRYTEAASLSGYYHALTDPTTGDLFHGAAARRANDPTYRVTHLPVPPLRLFLSAGTRERGPEHDLRAFAAALPPGTNVTTVVVPGFGHSFAAWAQVLPQALSWASAGLPAATASAAALPGQHSVTP